MKRFMMTVVVLILATQSVNADDGYERGQKYLREQTDFYIARYNLSPLWAGAVADGSYDLTDAIRLNKFHDDQMRNAKAWYKSYFDQREELLSATVPAGLSRRDRIKYQAMIKARLAIPTVTLKPYDQMTSEDWEYELKRLRRQDVSGEWDPN